MRTLFWCIVLSLILFGGCQAFSDVTMIWCIYVFGASVVGLLVLLLLIGIVRLGEKVQERFFPSPTDTDTKAQSTPSSSTPS